MIKRFLSISIFIAIFAVVGLLAFLAMPRDGNEVVVNSSETADNVAGSQAQLAPEAPEAALNWTAMAIPLANAGPTDASTVASYIDSGGAIKQISYFDPAAQLFKTWDSALPFLENFPVSEGSTFLVRADNSLPITTVTWVGDVPAMGAVTYTLVSGWNPVMIPLDQSQLGGSPAKTISDLASDIGGVLQIAYFDADSQQFVTWDAALPFLNDDDVYLGYPYLVRSNGSVTSWP